MGIHNYDMLTETKYQNDFAYFPCLFPNRGLYAISQNTNKNARKLSFDLVRLVIDLPYVPTETAKRLEFSEYNDLWQAHKEQLGEVCEDDFFEPIQFFLKDPVDEEGLQA